MGSTTPKVSAPGGGKAPWEAVSVIRRSLALTYRLTIVAAAKSKPQIINATPNTMHTMPVTIAGVPVRFFVRASGSPFRVNAFAPRRIVAIPRTNSRTIPIIVYALFLKFLKP